jgi:hypothetical protein
MRALKWIGIYLLFLVAGSLIALLYFSRDLTLEHRLKVESSEEIDLREILDSAALYAWKNSFEACSKVEGNPPETGSEFYLDFYSEGERFSGIEKITEADRPNLVKTTLRLNEVYVLDNQYVIIPGGDGFYWLEGKTIVKPQGFFSGLYLVAGKDLLKDKLIDEMNGIKSFFE